MAILKATQQEDSTGKIGEIVIFKKWGARSGRGKFKRYQAQESVRNDEKVLVAAVCKGNNAVRDHRIQTLKTCGPVAAQILRQPGEKLQQILAFTSGKFMVNNSCSVSGYPDRCNGIRSCPEFHQ